MFGKYVIDIVNVLGCGYLIHLLYFKGVDRLNFILGNALIVILIVMLVLKYAIILRVKKDAKKPNELIEEVVAEYEREKKGK